MRYGIDWRKREGIEPTGDIAASRPDLKSGGATSAPSASVPLVSPALDPAGRTHPRPVRRGGTYFFSASFRRRLDAFSFLFLRRRISRLRSVVIFAPSFPCRNRADSIPEGKGDAMKRWAFLLPVLLLPPSLLSPPSSRSLSSGSRADTATSNGRRTKTTFWPTST